MKNTALIVTVFALPLILAAFAVGWTLSGSEPEMPDNGPLPPKPVASTTPAEGTVARTTPEEDVPGVDLAGLPRYPGSTRVAYRHEKLKSLTRTRAEYATDADPDEIRVFYREAFEAEGWMVADLNFSPEQWYFFVVRDQREALVRIHARRQPVAVEIEMTGPGGTSNIIPAPPPLSSAPQPQPNEDGDDDEDLEKAEDYEGGDD